MAILLSMTTVPSRKERLMENLPSILSQSYNFKKLLICIDDNLSPEDKRWYYDLKKQDKRISIIEGPAKWRSCNKLLPAYKLYPNDSIITVDDDVFYPKHCLRELVEEHKKNPDCVICQEVNPITVDNEKKYVGFINGIDIKLRQREWGKSLSNCALYPPHIFDGTDVFDYDKMMLCTEGTHDELWFWLQYTLNRVQTIGLDYIFTFHYDVKTPWKEGEYRLANVNAEQATLDRYMDNINKTYPELFDIVTSKPVTFTAHPYNCYALITMSNYIKALYNYGFEIQFGEDMTSGWAAQIQNTFRKDEK